MRAIFIILILFGALSVCFGQHKNKLSVRYKHKHCHKWHLLHKFHILAFLALKVKAILVIGSIWALTIMFGKVFAAIKLGEYMKKNSEPTQIIYSHPPHYDHGAYGKSIHADSSSPELSYDYPPKGYTVSPESGFMDAGSPFGYGRNDATSNNNGTLESFSVFFDAIRRSNLSEIVFNEMDLETEACKRKFVCQVDFNSQQVSILDTIFNMFIDDSYKKYRTKEVVTTLEDCNKFNPTCEEIDNS